ncbi:TylF/MycF/NovP-related O-methyltransferase [Smaragdicoccus niigatensis]|uniref:TylF/MycF/NovP-related O-methyltransferase n=1 Tax=Smaragdicoccus niigatensis TaxID=359359 RepID=UPI000374E739|nr:TylF/MycF/NovP-related O-methyltransferase [Smaragdicoccus niigatensis]
MTYKPRFSLEGTTLQHKVLWARKMAAHNVVRPRELLHPADLARGAALHAKLRSGGWTMTSSRHGRTLYALARDIRRNGVPGALIDCGARNGGSSVLLGSGAGDRTVWALDSFEGLPSLTAEDGRDASWAGELKGSEQMLAEGFAKYAPDVDYRIVKGWFNETLPSVHVDKIAVLHIDADLYESVKDVLDALVDRVSPGGYVVIDDYQSWDGCRVATDEYLAAHPEITFVDKHYWQVPA